MTPLTLYNRIRRVFGNRKLSSKLLDMLDFGYFVESGWNMSYCQGKPVDNHERPIPWFSLPCVAFLTSRLRTNMRVYEFGAGNSTLFFAERVKEVHSVEHSRRWFDSLSEVKPENASLSYCPESDKSRYVSSIRSSGLIYDLIVVDGLYRVETLEVSPSCLSVTGVILLDNSERGEYDPGKRVLYTQGFRCLEFWGVAAGAAKTVCTSIFYRSENALGI